MVYLGLQDANRKRIPNHQTPGEWKGYNTLSLGKTDLFVTVSERNWGRAKEIICNMLEIFNESDHFLEMYLKEMAWKTGFLLHLDMEYPLIIPFMRGIYLTMNSWWPKRDRDDWKLSKRDYDSFINAGKRQGNLGYSSGSREEAIAPKMVNAVG